MAPKLPTGPAIPPESLLPSLLPPAENSRLTQIATTGPTYERAVQMLRDAGILGPLLDYGAGRGHGARASGLDSFEPYPPPGFEPTFRNSADIPDDSYGGLVNLNVLNVLAPELRDHVVGEIGRIMAPKGQGVITTRGRDVMSAKGEPGPEPMSLIIGEGDKARYQKGFTRPELVDYLTRTLGPNFEVSPADLGPAGARVTRLRAETGGPRQGGDGEADEGSLWDTAAGLGRSALDAFFGPALGAVVAERVASLPARVKGVQDEIVKGNEVTRRALRGEDLSAADIETLIGNPAAGFGTADVGAVGNAVPYLGKIFAGPKAKTANLAHLEQAKALEAKGGNPAPDGNIRLETGWFRDEFGDWKYEIPDNEAAQLLPDPDLVDVTGGQVSKHKLGDVIAHDAFFEAYPDLAQINVYKDSRHNVRGGEFFSHDDDPTKWSIRLGGDPTRRGVNPSILLHEMQHGVQTAEGFNRGGHPSAFNRDVLADVFSYDMQQLLAKHPEQAALYRQFLAQEAGTDALARPPGGGIQASQGLQDALEETAAGRDILQKHHALMRVADDTQDIQDLQYQGYQRLLGEIEARDVQRRMTYEDWQRQAIPPYSSQHIPPDQMLPSKPETNAAISAMAAEPPGGGNAPPKKPKKADIIHPDFFDYRNLSQVPDVPQFDLERTIPPKGPSERVQALDKRSVIRKVNAGVDRGAQMGGIEWYNTEPLRKAFIDYLGPEEGQRRFGLYMDMVAATSPRSKVAENVRNASYYYQQALTGGQPAKPLPEPYGHLAQNLHLQNFRNIMESGGTMQPGGGFPILDNPKPPSFSQNLQGNQRPVTADTHYVRKFAMSANTPDWLVTSLTEKKGEPPIHPRHLVESGQVPISKAKSTWWESAPRSNEYGFLEMLGQREAAKKGMSPAQYQASGWIGAGAETGLASGGDPFLRHFENRLRLTADQHGLSMQDALEQVIDGRITLLSAPMPRVPPDDDDVVAEVDPEARARQAAISTWIGMAP